MNEQTTINLTEANAKRERIGEAIATYTQILVTQGERPEIYANLGSLYGQQQQWDEAISCYQRAIALAPQFAGVYRNLARVLAKAGREKESAESWYQALILEPNWVKAEEHYNLGNTLWHYQKFVKAANCYRHAIQLQPSFTQAYRRLGQLLTKQGKLQQAIAAYRQAIAHNPQQLEFYFCLGQIFVARQNWQQAIKCYQQILKLDSNSALAYFNLGAVQAQKQQWYQAIESYQQAISLNPNYWEAYHQLGKVLTEKQKWQQAIAAYEKTIELNPQFIPAYLRLGAILHQRNKYQRAITTYRQAIKFSADSSLLEMAIAGYHLAVEENPRSTAEDYYWLGKLLREKRKFVEAIAAYQKALLCDDNFQPAYIDLQYTSTPTEILEEAIEFYRKLIDANPSISIAWGNLGDLLTKKGDLSAALQCYHNSCYQKTIAVHPQLADNDWKFTKQNGPDFIIIGAAKCGTSSLYHYLSRHSQILLPHKKELDFFWKNYQLGIDWYLAQFPAISDREEFRTGEATPNYIRFPEVARRIYEFFPQTKLIVLLRNPIERAVSWHYHKVHSGLAQGTFEAALATEIEQLADFTTADFTTAGYRNPDNLLSSLYYYQLKAWMDIFPREQFLILKSQDLYENPAIVMEQVFAFLDLPDCQLAQYPQINAGSYRQIDPNLRRRLADYFLPHNQKLERYLNFQFNWN